MFSDPSSGAAFSIDDPPLAAAVLGRGLPDEAEDELWLAGLAYHLDDVAERHLRQAAALAPGHVTVLIGLYRFYFYKGRLSEALGVAEQCLATACAMLRIDSGWRDAEQHHADFSSFDSIVPRFFLFTLKGYAYLQMRLGRLEAGREASLKLLALDPSDKVGAKVLMAVLDRAGVDDDE